MSEPVLLTGMTGFIGLHCPAVLLRQGDEAVGAIRSQAKTDATGASIAQVAAVDRLSLVKAGLLSNTRRAKAMTGCTFVMRFASAFSLAKPKDENLLAHGAEGSKRVIAAAPHAGVKRLAPAPSLVVTVAGTESGRYGPDDGCDIDAGLAARLHIKALTAEGAAGKRFIAAGSRPTGIAKTASIRKNAGYAKVLSRKAPNIDLDIMAPLEREVGGMLPMPGEKASHEKRATFEVRPAQTTPVETPFRETAAAVAA